MARPTATPLDRQLARARRRLIALALLHALAWGWVGALVLGAGWFLIQPYLVAEAPAGLRWYVLGGLAGAGTLVAVVLAGLRAPAPLAAALALDERFGLKERVTTALTLEPAQVSSPAGQALLADVNARVQPLRVADRFPLRLPRVAALVPALGLLLALIALFWNPAGPAGSAGAEQPLAVEPAVQADLDRKLKQLEKKARLKQPADRPKSAEMERLEAELDKLAHKPPRTREEARAMVKDLTGAEDQVKKRDKELAQRAQALKEQMRQLDRLTKKQARDGPAKKLEKALDQAEFRKAKEEAERLGQQLEANEQAERLRKKLKEDRLSEEEKREAREQLEKLKDQELSRAEREQLEKQMQDVRDKLERLTRSDAAREALRELHRQGLINQEQLDRELEQLEKNDGQLDAQTKKTLEEVAKKLREAHQCLKEGKDGEAAQKLKEAGELLEKLDAQGECRALAQQVRDLEAARQALCRALDGAPKPAPGGPGGPAAGPRPESKEGETGAKEEWVHSDLDKGRLQVIDHVPGDGFKGPRKPAEMSEDIRRAAQEAPEAIDRQRLPRSASDMARGYFDKLRGDRKKD
jgi:hypothetical protein